jgi:protein-S-isoprenylcysteine O-methyltransferase Ste14
MTTMSRAARPDLGKLIMIPGAALMLMLDLVALAHDRADGAPGALRWLGAALVCAFYALIIWCYLRRPPAVASTSSIAAHLAAVAATLAPFVFPLLPAARSGAWQQGVADALLVCGTAWSVWSVQSLGRSLSVLAQARELVNRGPYRWVRHPLYTGEIVSCLGLLVAAGTIAAVATWLALCALQVFRARREEGVLLRALPGYRAYRSRTAALLPGVF